MDQIRWIKSACQGDLESFNYLVLSNQDLVFRQAFWMLGEPDAAEKVTQKTFLLAYQKLRSLREQDLPCWLLNITYHLCMEELGHQIPDRSSFILRLRNKGRNKTETMPWVYGLSASLYGDTNQNDLVKIILKALKKLPLEYLAVITLIDIQEMDYKQTAKILEISEGNVKSCLARARVQLRSVLIANNCLTNFAQEYATSIRDDKSGVIFQYEGDKS